MLTKVTEENLQEFLDGRRIARIDGDSVDFYRFLCSLTEFEGKYLVAQNTMTCMPERLYIPHITNEFAPIPFFYYDSLNDVYLHRIEWHKHKIEMLKDFISKDREVQL